MTMGWMPGYHPWAKNCSAGGVLPVVGHLMDSTADVQHSAQPKHAVTHHQRGMVAQYSAAEGPA